MCVGVGGGGYRRHLLRRWRPTMAYFTFFRRGERIGSGMQPSRPTPIFQKIFAFTCREFQCKKNEAHEWILFHISIKSRLQNLKCPSTSIPIPNRFVQIKRFSERNPPSPRRDCGPQWCPSAPYLRPLALAPLLQTGWPPFVCLNFPPSEVTPRLV